MFSHVACSSANWSQTFLVLLEPFIIMLWSWPVLCHARGIRTFEFNLKTTSLYCYQTFHSAAQLITLWIRSIKKKGLPAMKWQLMMMMNRVILYYISIITVQILLQQQTKLKRSSRDSLKTSKSFIDGHKLSEFLLRYDILLLHNIKPSEWWF